MSERPSEHVDDCWKRIGIWGDRSCERLPRHIHCHNCERYSAAATELLDRYVIAREAGQELPVPTLSGTACIVFRIHDQWLALPSRMLVEVALVRPIHRLPHQQNVALLGVSNVRGTLVACLSLAHLLQIASADVAANGRRVLPRMLVLDMESGPIVVPVDEVAGIERLDLQSCASAYAAKEHSLSYYAQGVLQQGGRSLTLLAPDKLNDAMEGALQ